MGEDINDKMKCDLGNLLSGADALSRKVISAYDPVASHKMNIDKISKFDATHLEQAAVYLGFTVRDADNKKMYQNQNILCDRMVLKIESFFETTCEDCGEKYTNKLTDSPPISCRLCLQGSHNCARVTERVDAYKKLCDEGKALVGLLWICHGCSEKNNPSLLFSKEQSKPGASNAKTGKTDDGVASGSNVTTDPTASLYSTIAAKDPPAKDPAPSLPVCEAYLKMNCPHGRTGKKLINGVACSKAHPPRCFRYCKYGAHGAGSPMGCKNGDKCKYMHPKLCRDSVNKRVCLNSDCKFFHLKFTRRKGTQQSNDEQSSNRSRNQQPNRRTRFDSTASSKEKGRSQTPSKKYTMTKSVKKPATTEEPSDENSFLYKLLENMQKGIIAQLSTEMSELRLSIPGLVRDNVQRMVGLQSSYPTLKLVQ